MSDAVNIRAIQHYLYCPHRWGLIEIGCCWAENYYVVKADLLHNRVHNPDRNYTLNNKKVFSSVNIWNDSDEYGLFGVADCVEAVESENSSVIISGKGYELCIVEYKPTKPKDRDYNFDDAMQVYAQKKCIDYVFGGDCKAVLYYADAKKRVSLPFESMNDMFNEKLKEVLLEIRKRRQSGIIPPIEQKQNCNGCSMKDLCMPKTKRLNDIRHRIISATEDEICENF